MLDTALSKFASRFTVEGPRDIHALAAAGLTPHLIKPGTKAPATAADGEVVLRAEWANPYRSPAELASMALLATTNPAVGVGLVCRDNIAALDIDLRDLGQVEAMLQAFKEVCGTMPPIRLGCPPKVMVFFHPAPGDMPSGKQVVRLPSEADPKGQIEWMMGGKCQAVVSGPHVNGGRYLWDRDFLTSLQGGELPVIGLAQQAAIMSRFHELYSPTLSMAGRAPLEPLKVDAGDRATHLPRAALQGIGGPPTRPQPASSALLMSTDPESLAMAIDAFMPPIYGHDDWIRFGQALHGAFGDTETARDLWRQQADLYPGAQERDISEVWGSLKGERAGVPQLLRLLRDWGCDVSVLPDRTAQAAHSFDQDPLPCRPTHTSGANGDRGRCAYPDPIAVRPVLEASRLPKREEVVANLAIKGEVSILSGSSGTGKTVLAVAIGAHAAVGRSFGPFVPSGRQRVLFLSQEEPLGAVCGLIRAACQAHDLDPSEVASGMLVRAVMASGDEGLAPQNWQAKSPLCVLAQEIGGVVHLTDEGRAIEDLIKREGITLVIADPLVGLLAISNENSNRLAADAMEAVRGIARSSGSAWLVLHHTPKMNRDQQAASRDEVTMARGAGAIVGASRLAATLTALTSDEDLESTRDNPLLVYQVVKRNDRPRGEPGFFRLRGEVIETMHGPDTRRVALAATRQKVEPFPLSAQNGVLRKLHEGFQGEKGTTQFYGPVKSGLRSDVAMVAARACGCAPLLAKQEAKKLLQEWRRSKIITLGTYLTPQRKVAARWIVNQEIAAKAGISLHQRNPEASPDANIGSEED